MAHKRRFLLLIAGILAAAAAVGGVILTRQGSSSVSTGGGPDTTIYPTATKTPPSNSPTAPQMTTVSTPATPPAGEPTVAPSLREGSVGPVVLALQQRLLSLGFWLGDADARYGPSTLHAIVAFQKAHGLPRDGVAGPRTLLTLTNASRDQARSSTGHLVEIDLSRQLLLIVDNGRVEWVMDASTGVWPGSTPTGMFQVFRQVDGYDRSPLGVLYRPKYFSNGVAIHGYAFVPTEPASHGCVRVTNAEIDWLWSHHEIPIGTTVWVY